MRKSIELMKQKNRLLKKFYRLNESELVNFSLGNFDHIQGFYFARETLLNMVAILDERLKEQDVYQAKSNEFTDIEKKEIQNCLNIKNDLVTKILEQDLQVLSMVESAKTGLIKELSQARVTRKAVGSYHSGHSEAQLDEEI